MKTLAKTQIKLLQRKHGNSLCFVLLYRFLKNIFCLLGLGIWGMIAWELIEQKHLTQSIYEQLVLFVSFLCILLLKKEKQYALVPYINKLTISRIRNYILVRELFSVYNFFLFPLIAPVIFLSETIEFSISNCFFLFIYLGLIGLFLNLLTRILKYFCIKYRLVFWVVLSFAITYIIILILFYRTQSAISFSDFWGNHYFIYALLFGIIFLIPGLFYIIKQELYYIYDGHHFRDATIHRLNLKLIPSTIFIKVLLLKYFRCKVFEKFLTQIVSYALAAIAVILLFDLKIMGLGMLLGIYTFNILPFTIYLSSNYFDGIYTKPVSIRSLLSTSFHIHLIITTLLFLVLLIFLVFFDRQFIIPLIALYLFTSGPLGMLLLLNILFAERFDLFPVQSDFRIHQTFVQSTTKVLSAICLLGCATILHFFPIAGFYTILLLSLPVIIIYPFWINILHRKFKQRKHQIMSNLR